jgi:regulatory protein
VVEDHSSTTIGGPAVEAGPDPVMAAAARYLTRRARSEAEVRSHLSEKGFDGDEVDACARRLHELQLIDDAQFARAWVAERSGRRGLAGEALLAELVGKGVARETAEAAIAEAGLDELGRAVELVHQHVRRVHHLPVRDQIRRLLAVLGRRGYSQEVSFAAVKRVFPPEGWD